ncbi:signal peptidase complex catalytic subunit SEC11C [Penicillium riverlandense]|uniref:signal peptidase complex catalytic subunit SEC11C n=1 Tax=Penicillium riverlandense TaxID=1903569 RepID=UPI0025487691|nr:signal peptidase complex catalytic subunit SEC11C [Penicillium riverlandense]KAJ5818549.1 signal peptidase complex catalytic subunit SEC11C [Penicillium riverlandense]
MLSFFGTSATNMRQQVGQALNFALVLSTAFMLWKSLSVFSASSSPIVVVLSGSMEPAFQRGDLLFLWNRSPRADIGEIVVYNVRGKRAKFPRDSAPNSHMLLTKGDNNPSDDTELYARGQDYLNREEDLVGSVRGYIPSVGYVTIMLSEHPWLKTVLLGVMGLMVMLQRE